jgi:hypothetical protein
MRLNRLGNADGPKASAFASDGRGKEAQTVPPVRNGTIEPTAEQFVVIELDCAR